MSLYIKSTREEGGGGGVGCTNASGGGGHFLKMVSCSHIKFALNDAQTLSETKFDLYKCKMRRHV